MNLAINPFAGAWSWHHRKEKRRRRLDHEMLCVYFQIVLIYPFYTEDQTVSNHPDRY